MCLLCTYILCNWSITTAWSLLPSKEEEGFCSLYKQFPQYHWSGLDVFHTEWCIHITQTWQLQFMAYQVLFLFCGNMQEKESHYLLIPQLPELQCVKTTRLYLPDWLLTLLVFGHWLFTTPHSSTQIWLLNAEWKDFSDSCDCRSLLESFDLHLCLDPAMFSIVDSEHLKIVARNAPCHF